MAHSPIAPATPSRTILGLALGASSIRTDMEPSQQINGLNRLVKAASGLSFDFSTSSGTRP
eukprot:scaffold45420_cov46-Prasinocladus_malaysianus.AAC.1